MATVRRVLGYARVSSAEQAIGTSLDDQTRAIVAYAATRGVRPGDVRMYIEAESGVGEKESHRVQVHALLESVREGDLVCVDKLDRWSRNPEFIYSSTRRIREKGGSFFAVSESLDPDTSSGALLLGFRATIAASEHERIRARTVGTRLLLQDQGYYAQGAPPLGYARRDVKGAERNALVIVPRDAARVVAMFDDCIAGSSLREIAKRHGIGERGLHTLLHSRHYLGEVRNSHRQWIKARHDAIIDARRFLAAQEALAGRQYGDRKPRSEAVTASWWLRDVARCLRCGNRMGSAYGFTKADGSRSYYYKCSHRCTRGRVRVDAVEAEVDPLVVDRLVELRDLLAAPPPKVAASTVDVAGLKVKLQRRRTRLAEAYADGAMDRTEFRAALAKLDAERTRLDAIAQPIEPPTPGQAAAAFKRVSAIASAWRHAPGDKRRAVMRGLARAVRMAAEEPSEVLWFSADEIAYRAKGAP